ncbi:AAA family ATPase, partial [Streptomyces sp. WAC05950]
LLWGEPGIGKSAGMEQLATALGVPLETVIASVHEPSDFAGLPIVGDDPATTGVPMAPPDWAVRLARTGHGLLFFDELSSAPPAVQAALLRVVLERRVGSLELPASVRIVAAANPPASAADGWHLSPPLANRFVHLDWTHNPRTVARGMSGTWPEVAIPTVDPARASGAVARARGAVSGFLTARPGLVHHMPAEAAGRGRGWPSPRTWEMALRLLATGYAASTGREALAAALTGAVGEAAGIELLSYLEHLDLP